jgi:hypothetical protein
MNGHSTADTMAAVGQMGTLSLDFSNGWHFPKVTETAFVNRTVAAFAAITTATRCSPPLSCARSNSYAEHNQNTCARQ